MVRSTILIILIGAMISMFANTAPAIGKTTSGWTGGGVFMHADNKSRLNKPMTEPDA